MSEQKEMKYFSTRGGSEELSFEEAVLTGLAPNGGLYIPTHIPKLPENWQSEWSGLSFSDLSFKILSLFIPESSIPSSDLKTIIDKSYGTFRHSRTTPLRQTGEREYVLELWHGPTWAFKDVALQFLGNVFDFALQRKNANLGPDDKKHELTVVGATSGDTGSAAIYGLRSKPSVSIFILYPEGRVSPIQLAQMATVPDENVHCVAVQNADFDACQSIVKSLFSDKEFNDSHRLGAINSINWARILAQIVYYFHAWFSLPAKQRGANGDEVQFTVPTGNFGDILAGYFAKRLGLPMRELVVATNENDILERFWKTGRYEKEDSSAPKQEQAPETAVVEGSSDGSQAQHVSAVKATHSPAMDILVSSNFERLLYYLALETEGGEDRTKAQAKLASWMEALKTEGKVDMGSAVQMAAQRDFKAERVSDEQTLKQIQDSYTASDETPESTDDFGSYVVDPHTAVGLAATARVKQQSPPNTTHITLATAHPAKFSEAVQLALPTSRYPNFNFENQVLPDELKTLASMEQRVHKVHGEKGVRELIERIRSEKGLEKGAKPEGGIGSI